MAGISLHPALLLLAIYGMALVIDIALTYSYSPLTALETGVGFALLLATAGFLWLTRRRPILAGDGFAGLLLGLLWSIEISINNFIAPPLPGRDIIDNGFWAAIGISMLVYAALRAHQANRLAGGLEAGIWTGLVSGLLACCMALSVIVFAMPFITRDPLNLAEWAALGTASSAPSMAAYFAFETFAGAFLHLVVLGVGMGGLVGLLGGLAGRIK